MNISRVSEPILCLCGLSLSATLWAGASGAPGKFSISHDQYQGDTDGEFTIKCDMWYGNNATSYTIYEKQGADGDYTAAAAGTLDDKTPDAQNLEIPFTGKDDYLGTYYYYGKFCNSYGCVTTDEVSLSVGGSSSGGGTATTESITLKGLDSGNYTLQLTQPAGETGYTLSCAATATPNYEVSVSNPDVAQASVSEGVLTVNGLKPGRSGIVIHETTTDVYRYVGLCVLRSDGSRPGLPDYVAVGSVSEDTQADLAFWHDLGEGLAGKRCDIRYVYINGGHDYGWRTWTDVDGYRVTSYLKESLKLGMIPYFVYYNIPDGGESYTTDLEHIQSTSYMTDYYLDLKFFLELCAASAQGEMVGIVLEPDFIGYMMQNAGTTPDNIAAAGVAAAYTSGVLDSATDPVFPNTLAGVVQSINYTIRKYYPSARFGWQFNTWGYNGAPGQGLMHATETMGQASGRAFIQKAAETTANYYLSAGILSYGADFISVDKYGLDGAYEGKADPSESRWFWNADLWNNYLFYVSILHQTTGKPVTLWQIPVGHINHSTLTSPYTGSAFTDLANTETHYEDSAPTYFFGDTFEPGTSARLTYFSTNNSGDNKVTASGSQVTWGSHMEESKAAGVDCILFGAGVGSSTDGVGNPPTDDYWWITALQRYYQAPVAYDRTGVTGCAAAPASGVYPNPCDGPLTLRAATDGQHVWRVRSLNGQTLAEGTFSGLTATVSAGHLPKGLYLLQLDGETIKFIRK